MSPASGKPTCWGPRPRLVGTASCSCPSQAAPRVACSSWGAAPVLRTTTSTASGRRRSFSSSGPPAWASQAPRSGRSAAAFWGEGARPLASSGVGSSTIARAASSKGMEERRGPTRFRVVNVG
ncbi:MAG: hypothetical protein ACK5N0_08825 [Synechococcaceae cyanobacterium]